jgi:hypothetical protein
MTKKILAGVTALAIATASIVGSTATADAHHKAMPAYNPTYCVLFLPFLCMPPAPAPHKAAPKHKAKMKM